MTDAKLMKTVRKKLNAMEELIGKYCEILNIDNAIIHRIEIKEVKFLYTPAKKHSDGTESPARKDIMVSENGSGWYRIHGRKMDRIVKN